MKGLLDKDQAAGLFLVALGVVYYRMADALPRSLISDRVGASGFPKLLASALVIFSAVMIVQSVVRRLAGTGPPPDEGVDKSGKEFLQAAGMLGLGIGYLLVVSSIGYLLSIALLLAAALRYQKEPLSVRLFLTAALGGVFFWAFFVFALDTPMPSGPWAHLVGWR